ncbi:hypothetical membrane protein [Sphingobium sp. SYK-6]|uniref:YjgN family protein n=1 Tax=Sphingobium sp. (strain NBRC 103272 / SYK-6) TaxID=627192 RepID=UPI0002276B2D|nr:YjgN family protein [Sphingobium sp. SYK-6]BAK64826.1 hypothetical membrane protein [Sphingobium sp. SYK-6]
MEEPDAGAFAFTGDWRDYAPIAFTNLLLTIVTLGVYRFWATTRTRRYLWSRTRFIDEPLEWTGTGMELFIGFLLVLALFGIPLLFLQFGMQALIFNGQAPLAFSLAFLAFAMIFYLSGVARFRMLRYRLSRTWWHGIRGGSDENGWAYGWSYVWRYVVAAFSLYLLIPWAMMSLWNDRWSAMSFGPFPFRAKAGPGAVFKRFLLFYLLPLALFVLLTIAGIGMREGETALDPAAAAMVGFLFFFIYAGLGVIALVFYAKFFRVAVGGMSLSGLHFHFRARSRDWLMLILGDIALVVLTLGIGAIFLSYRHWKFFITHLYATGEISLSELTQSTTAAPRQGEGLADAFDIGAI